MGLVFELCFEHLQNWQSLEQYQILLNHLWTTFKDKTRKRKPLLGPAWSMTMFAEHKRNADHNPMAG